MVRPHRVAVLIRHGVLPMELGLVHQLFGTARTPDGQALYEVLTCAPEPGPIRTDADFPVHAAHGLETVRVADTVIVPASHELDEVLQPGSVEGELADVLREVVTGSRASRTSRTARIASICTGAYVLASAGLLDGRRATTHWLSADHFARTFPYVTVDPDALYIDEGQVLTSAGEAAGIDLCLHLIRKDHGAAIATDVARRTVVPPHREGGQGQYIQRPVPEPELSSTATSRTWALDRLSEPLTLAQLAAQDGMSVRTYSRRFREETGLTPVRWLTARRLDRARALLEETDHTIDRIAAECGFGTGASMRQHFQAGVGVSPGAYRATFRGVRGGGGAAD
ncbi:helix-turn-helix domain-containing protein [Streptomyces sp. NA04227]|uniref:GlxA family transcriptional regulator n=1 Tax=Streptomyces sp. NA04227 TaxID=2742136 RepID=UPI001590665A|nr:helix-turn-helix domain-containing protein [Streptomyces sp. NA04227]QKW10776.1 helix-turn-helix domain-containing protein [Streptomyces sp. NA04227]